MISHSGPGVSPVVQERGRLETVLRVVGLESADLDEAMGWVDGRILDFDPVSVLRSITCPTLAMFGGGDAQVDAWQSTELFARHLPRSLENALVVFPLADHGLFIAERHPDVPA